MKSNTRYKVTRKFKKARGHWIVGYRDTIHEARDLAKAVSKDYPNATIMISEEWQESTIIEEIQPK